MAAPKSTPEIALPDALRAPTREYVELLVAPLRDGLDLYEGQAREQQIDTRVGPTIRAARRFLAQLERALPADASE